VRDNRALACVAATSGPRVSLGHERNIITCIPTSEYHIQEADPDRRPQQEADLDRRPQQEADLDRRPQKEADPDRRPQQEADPDRRPQQEADPDCRPQQEAYPDCRPQKRTGAQTEGVYSQVCPVFPSRLTGHCNMGHR
jgi:hypothetical protein